MTNALSAKDAAGSSEAEDSGGRVGSPDPRTTAPFSANGAQPSLPAESVQPAQSTRTNYDVLNGAPGASFARSFIKDEDETDGDEPGADGQDAGTGGNGPNGAPLPQIPNQGDAGGGGTGFETSDPNGKPETRKPEEPEDTASPEQDPKPAGQADAEAPQADAEQDSELGDIGQETPTATDENANAEREEPYTTDTAGQNTTPPNTNPQDPPDEEDEATSDSILSDAARKERENANRGANAWLIVSALAGGIADAATTIPSGLMRLVRAAASGRPAPIADAFISGMADSINSMSRGIVRTASNYAVPDRNGAVNGFTGNTLETRRSVGMKQGNQQAIRDIAGFVDGLDTDKVGDSKDILLNELTPEQAMKLFSEYGNAYRAKREALSNAMDARGISEEDKRSILAGYDDAFSSVYKRLKPLNGAAEKDARVADKEARAAARLDNKKLRLADIGMTLSSVDERNRNIAAHPLSALFYTRSGGDVVSIDWSLDGDGNIQLSHLAQYAPVIKNIQEMKLNAGSYTTAQLNNMGFSNTDAFTTWLNNTENQLKNTRNGYTAKAVADGRLNPLTVKEYNSLRQWDRLAVVDSGNAYGIIPMDGNMPLMTGNANIDNYRLRRYRDNVWNMHRLAELMIDHTGNLSPDEKKLLSGFGFENPKQMAKELGDIAKYVQDEILLRSASGQRKQQIEDERKRERQELVDNWRLLPEAVGWLFGLDAEHVSDNISSSRATIGKALDAMERANGNKVFFPGKTASDAVNIIKRYRTLEKQFEDDMENGFLSEKEFTDRRNKIDPFLFKTLETYRYIAQIDPPDDPDLYIQHIAMGGGNMRADLDENGILKDQRRLTRVIDEANSLGDTFLMIGEHNKDADAIAKGKAFKVIAGAYVCYSDMMDAKNSGIIDMDDESGKVFESVMGVMRSIGAFKRGDMNIDKPSSYREWDCDSMNETLDNAFEWINANSLPQEESFVRSVSGSDVHGFENGIDGLGHGRSAPATSESFFKEEDEDKGDETPPATEGDNGGAGGDAGGDAGAQKKTFRRAGNLKGRTKFSTGEEKPQKPASEKTSDAGGGKPAENPGATPPAGQDKPREAADDGGRGEAAGKPKRPASKPRNPVPSSSDKFFTFLDGDTAESTEIRNAITSITGKNSPSAVLRTYSDSRRKKEDMESWLKKYKKELDKYTKNSKYRKYTGKYDEEGNEIYEDSPELTASFDTYDKQAEKFELIKAEYKRASKELNRISSTARAAYGAMLDEAGGFDGNLFKSRFEYLLEHPEEVKVSRQSADWSERRRATRGEAAGDAQPRPKRKRSATAGEKSADWSERRRATRGRTAEDEEPSELYGRRSKSRDSTPLSIPADATGLLEFIGKENDETAAKVASALGDDLLKALQEKKAILKDRKDKNGNGRPLYNESDKDKLIEEREALKKELPDAEKQAAAVLEEIKPIAYVMNRAYVDERHTDAEVDPAKLRDRFEDYRANGVPNEASVKSILNGDRIRLDSSCHRFCERTYDPIRKACDRIFEEKNQQHPKDWRNHALNLQKYIIDVMTTPNADAQESLLMFDALAHVMGDLKKNGILIPAEEDGSPLQTEYRLRSKEYIQLSEDYMKRVARRYIEANLKLFDTGSDAGRMKEFPLAVKETLATMLRYGKVNPITEPAAMPFWDGVKQDVRDRENYLNRREDADARTENAENELESFIAERKAEKLKVEEQVEEQKHNYAQNRPESPAEPDLNPDLKPDLKPALIQRRKVYPPERKFRVRNVPRAGASGNLQAPRQGRYAVGALLKWAGYDAPLSEPAQKCLDYILLHFDSDFKTREGSYPMTEKMVSSALDYKASQIASGMPLSESRKLADELRGVRASIGDREYAYSPKGSHTTISLPKLLDEFCDALEGKDALSMLLRESAENTVKEMRKTREEGLL